MKENNGKYTQKTGAESAKHCRETPPEATGFHGPHREYPRSPAAGWPGSCHRCRKIRFFQRQLHSPKEIPNSTAVYHPKPGHSLHRPARKNPVRSKPHPKVQKKAVTGNPCRSKIAFVRIVLYEIRPFLHQNAIPA